MSGELLSSEVLDTHELWHNPGTPPLVLWSQDMARLDMERRSGRAEEAKRAAAAAAEDARRRAMADEAARAREVDARLARAAEVARRRAVAERQARVGRVTPGGFASGTSSCHAAVR